MKILKSLLFGFTALIGLSSCQSGEHGGYYESFYEIDLNRKENSINYTFWAKPKSNGIYNVLLVLYPKNENEQDEAIRYAELGNITETFTVVTIKDLKGNLVYQEQAYINLGAVLD